jgi:neutral amino acid transport system permease protein
MRRNMGRPSPLSGVMALVGLIIALLGGAGPASAVTPTPVPSAAAQSIKAVAACAPNDTTGCMLGTLRDADGSPLRGIRLTLSGGGAAASATSDVAGQYRFAVSKSGPYLLRLDPATLPKGVKAAVTSKTITVTLGELQPGVFALTGHAKSGVAPTTGPTLLAQVWDQLAEGLLLGLLLALASIGLSLVYGTTGLSNFAHAEQVTLGGLLTYVFAIQLGLPFVLAAVLSIVLCAATGTMQDRLLWQPLRRRGIGLTQLMVVTIGLQLALEYTYQFVFGAGVLPVTTTFQVDTGPLDLTPNAYISMAISIVVLVAVGLLLLRTRIGRATRAVADNRALAAASGIDVDRIIRLVWTVSTGLAGLAGILYALVYSGIAWNTGAELLLLIFAAVTLGGLGTAFGALIGSLVIGLVTQLSSLVLSAELKYATALLILILVLLFRPQGILGRVQRIG